MLSSIHFSMEALPFRLTSSQAFAVQSLPFEGSDVTHLLSTPKIVREVKTEENAPRHKAPFCSPTFYRGGHRSAREIDLETNGLNNKRGIFVRRLMRRLASLRDARDGPTTASSLG
jgi:hypothetical protein